MGGRPGQFWREYWPMRKLAAVALASIDGGTAAIAEHAGLDPADSVRCHATMRVVPAARDIVRH
jgi:hypothetical protein